MIYLDASALAKLVLTETETPALQTWLAQRPTESRFTNVIGSVELRRLAARASTNAVAAAAEVLEGVDEMALTSSAARIAAVLAPPALHTLDALHVASASEIAELSALVSYDTRVIAAATAYGLPVVSPGLAA